MPESTKANAAIVKHPDDNRTYGFGFGPVLPSGVTIASVQSISISGSDSSLTATGEAVITSDTTDANGKEIKANEGAKAKLAGGTDGVDYTVHIVGRDSDGEDIGGDWPVHVRGGS